MALRYCVVFLPLQGVCRRSRYALVHQCALVLPLTPPWSRDVALRRCRTFVADTMGLHALDVSTFCALRLSSPVLVRCGSLKAM